ncbi:hypothetical protein SAMN05660642_04637 [Geodermatophilus siccatus]|uniref:Uncharacterized protein n=1 Tax=Geodermatophilus siccatus TaxID=1137991 RepID=A0A1H0ANZ6_9ACTN|nr:hypothetical protein [Geodermatophilus siccatus]SDN35109.1 hypothetical protein SAMN05660642_04637 [Geodermatophilus siccatus]
MPVPDRHRFDPARPVWALHDDGRWYEAFQTWWIRQDDGSWRAHVSYTVAPGSTFLRAVDADQVRPRD